MKNDFFKLKDHGTTVRREVLAVTPISLTRTGTSMFTLPTESLHTKLCQLLNMITDTL